MTDLGSIVTIIWLMRRLQREYKDAHEKQVLYTLGDAISSFMKDPDPTTKNMCLATKDDFLTKRPRGMWFEKQRPKPHQQPREFKDEPKGWRKAASLRRWVVLMSM